MLGWLMNLEKRQMTTRRKQRAPANRPIVLNAIGGPMRYGLAGGVTLHPLVIKALGNDGLPPHDRKGKPVALRVQFETVRVPKGEKENLLGDGLKRITLETDEQGRASVEARLGKTRGAYVFAATVLKFRDGADVDFTAVTDGAVAVMQAAPVKPGSVEDVTRLRVTALDWQDKPVTNARLGATVLYGFQRPEVSSFKGKHLGGGEYEFAIRSTQAATVPVEILDVTTDTRLQLPIPFLPGRIRNLKILPSEDPRERPPFNQTRLDAIASDRFGNVVPDARVKWAAGSGRFMTLAPSPQVSASAIYRFGEAPDINVTASIANRTARTRLKLAGTYVRFAEKENFILTGDPFKVWVEVFAPPGGGLTSSLVARLREPVRSARRTHVRQPNKGNGVPEPEVVTGKDGRLDLRVKKMNVALSEYDGALLIAELWYDCLADGLACFETLAGEITIARSPDEKVPLPPGFTKCVDQKEKDPRRLCLQVYIPVDPTRPDSFDSLKDDFDELVKRTQRVFDRNIAACCPKVVIKTCYKEIDWRQYQEIVGEGEVRGVLEQEIVGKPQKDPAKDIAQLSPEVKLLFRRFRERDCANVFYVPEHRYKDAFGWRTSNGFTASPNDYPESTKPPGNPGILIRQGVDRRDRTLVHELGHLLIDLPRDANGKSDEHVPDSEIDRVMRTNPPAGRDFTRDECLRIFMNLAKYGGDCDD
jgi:hypothetical protein